MRKLREIDIYSGKILYNLISLRRPRGDLLLKFGRAQVRIVAMLRKQIP